MPDARRLRTVKLLLDELEMQIALLDDADPGNEHVCRAAINARTLQRNLRPLMARERERA